MEDSSLDTNPEASTPVEVAQDITPEASATNNAGPVRNGRKQDVNPENVKNTQFTARATTKEANRINNVIEARKQRTGKHSDIVRLVLELLDHVESDMLSSFKTKKKS